MPKKVKYSGKINEKKIHDNITEIIIFLTFLICTHIVADSLGTKYTFYNNELAKSLFVSPTIWTKEEQYFAMNFEHIKTIDNVYDYIQMNYLQHLYNNTIFKNVILVLGAPRIRQIRVKPLEKCLHSIKVDNLDMIPCYPEYSINADDDSYHDGPYKSDANKLVTKSYTYKGGGYSKSFHYKHNNSMDILNYICESAWIDRGTRLIVLELNLYYHATQMFQLNNIIFEVFPTGIIKPSWHIQAIPLNCFIYLDTWVFYVGIIFYVIIAYYTYQEFGEIRAVGIASYVRELSNYGDIILLMSSYFSLAYNIWHALEIKLLTTTFVMDPGSFINLHSLEVGWNFYIISMGMITFFAWLKLLRFVAFHRTLKRLEMTFKMAIQNIMGLFCIYAVFILAFAQLGKVWFGDKLEDYKSIYAAVISVVRLVKGDLDYTAMETAQPTLAPIYLIVCFIAIYGILLNLFVAIILKTYAEVKSDYFIRDTEVLQMYAAGIKSYFCKSKSVEKLYIDNLINRDERPTNTETREESRAYVEPKWDLREELALLTERALHIEKVLERLVKTLELISKLQATFK